MVMGAIGGTGAAGAYRGDCGECLHYGDIGLD